MKRVAPVLDSVMEYRKGRSTINSLCGEAPVTNKTVVTAVASAPFSLTSM